MRSILLLLSTVLPIWANAGGMIGGVWWDTIPDMSTITPVPENPHDVPAGAPTEYPTEPVPDIVIPLETDVLPIISIVPSSSGFRMLVTSHPPIASAGRYETSGDLVNWTPLPDVNHDGHPFVQELRIRPEHRFVRYVRIR
jgi:hypothetical protein